MPANAAPTPFDTLMQGFYAQADIASEHWYKVLSLEEPLKKALKGWEGDVPTKNILQVGREGKITYCALSPSDFAEQDTVIANIGRSIKDYVDAVQELQKSFSNVTNEAISSGGDIGGHSDALTAASEHLETIVAQAIAANAAWQKGLGQFLPRYTKAKIQLLEAGTKMRPPRGK